MVVISFLIVVQARANPGRFGPSFKAVSGVIKKWLHVQACKTRPRRRLEAADAPNFD